MNRGIRVDLVFLGLSVVGLITHGAARPNMVADFGFAVSAFGAAVWMTILVVDLRRAGRVR